MCPYCQKTFKTNTNCKKHMKTHRHELAMEAVRAAGSNLQGDNQQALLTTSLYGQQSSATLSEADVSDLTGMTGVFQEGDFPLSGELQQQAHHQQEEEQGTTQVQTEVSYCLLNIWEAVKRIIEFDSFNVSCFFFFHECDIMVAGVF